MLTLMTLLLDLQRARRPLTAEEDLFLHQISDEIRRAPSDAARWQILKREGFSHPDDLPVDQDVLSRLQALHRASMN